MAVGTWDWARRTDGRLRRQDRWDQVLRGWMAELGPRSRRDPVGPLVVTTPPDTAFAREAFAEVRERSSDVLLDHCVRTWLWADLLAQLLGVRHDPELLFVSCLLHNLGLTPDYWCAESHCFAVDGARAAYRFAVERGYAPADAMAEAISLHLNVSVPVRRGPEAHLLHIGAAMDVTGARANRLPREIRDEVLLRHPRGTFAAEIESLSARQAQARPHSRIAFLRRHGFADLIGRGEQRFG
jgi:hypothetical protein